MAPTVDELETMSVMAKTLEDKKKIDPKNITKAKSSFMTKDLMGGCSGVFKNSSLSIYSFKISFGSNARVLGQF